MREFFGTDGIRGVANQGLLIPEFMLKISRAASRVLPSNSKKVILGKDSRVSGPMLESSLISGFLSEGLDVIDIGVVPTPAVSFLVDNSDADFGVMISASHNPIEDNGIKFFDKNGYKLDDDLELEIEKIAQSVLEVNAVVPGKVVYDNELIREYFEYILEKLPCSLEGMKIVCDAAWGAAAPWALQLFTAAGADTIVINGSPNGELINVSCGSTNTKVLSEMVIKSKSDLGLAFDGDADRIIAIDNNGDEVDGDGLKYLIATYLKNKGQLTNDAIVGTVMSNMGLEKALLNKGISLIRAQVGDRYVWEEMKNSNIVLGGEQSGHIINSNWQKTGDGMLNGLMIAAILNQTGTTFSKALCGFHKFPQRLINVEVKDKAEIMNNDELLNYAREVEEEMSGEGRLVLRPSGTQSMIRVMVEANTEEMTNEMVEKVARKVREISKK